MLSSTHFRIWEFVTSICQSRRGRFGRFSRRKAWQNKILKQNTAYSIQNTEVRSPELRTRNLEAGARQTVNGERSIATQKGFQLWQSIGGGRVRSPSGPSELFALG